MEEFEMDGQALRNTPTMPYVQPKNKRNHFFTDFAIKVSGGLIKTEEQANMVGVFLALLFIGASIFLFINSTKPKGPADQVGIESHNRPR